MPGEAVSRIVALIKRVGPLPGWPKMDAKKLFALMHADKKTRGGKVRFVLAARLGKASFVRRCAGEDGGVRAAMRAEMFAASGGGDCRRGGGDEL